MLWIPHLSDYLFWKFTYLVMVITWWYLTIFVHQVCLFTFRNKLSNPAVEQSLQAGLAQHLGACTASPDDVPVAWQEFTDTVQAVSKEAIGTVKYKHQDWFDESDMAI